MGFNKRSMTEQRWIDTIVGIAIGAILVNRGIWVVYWIARMVTE